MSKNVTYKLVNVTAFSKQTGRYHDSKYYLLSDFDCNQKIKLGAVNYYADDNYEYECGTRTINIARDGDDYIVNGFRLTSSMMNSMFETLKIMSTCFLFGYDNEAEADEYLNKKYNELGTLKFAEYLLSLRGSGLETCYCWDEWFDFDYIKEYRKELGYSDYIVNKFKANKRDVYSVNKYTGEICYDVRIRGCDPEEFIDEARDSMQKLVRVLMALEYNKNKAVA